MSWVGKKVYTINNQTNGIDKWECHGMFNGIHQGRKEKLCILVNGDKQCVLPRRAVFTTRYEAERVAKTYPRYPRRFKN